MTDRTGELVDQHEVEMTDKDWIKKLIGVIEKQGEHQIALLDRITALETRVRILETEVQNLRIRNILLR